ncbi:zf-DHHC-domain-containing protein [Xylariomycetidae sp. FL2044]|nr:zf-DHHC-domain-containing protein [Xylariomycetidae sp. FL2044]
MAFLVGETAPAIQRLAVPSVCLLIAFLGYASQYLFATSPDLLPGPLSSAETWVFNNLLACVWYTYYKAVTVDPGRYVFPPEVRKRKTSTDADEQKDDINHNNNSNSNSNNDNDNVIGHVGGRGRTRTRARGDTISGTGTRRRWCRKCSAPKPPRAHHCKVCRRCIPKMDHHCPWTANCVSLQTFPHFLRFLAYANAALGALGYLLARRVLALWELRHLPAYLGPTLGQLVLLTVLGLAGGVTGLALALLLAATLKGWLFNTTMIEGWEIDRHEAVLERRDDDAAGRGYWSSGAGSGRRLPYDENDEDESAVLRALEPVEFPYDIGFFANMAQAMGTANPLAWFLPFAGGPEVDNGRRHTASSAPAMTGPGWVYEENGLNDREGLWPPADPDKVRHARVWRRRQREMEARQGGPTTAAAVSASASAFSTSTSIWRSPEDEREAFRRRQERDLRRWQGTRSRILGELEEVGDYDDVDNIDNIDNIADYDNYGAPHVHHPRTPPSPLGPRGRKRRRAQLPVATGGQGRRSVSGTMTTMAPDRGSGSGSGGFHAGWVNAEGEQLADFGVDEDDADFFLEEDYQDEDLYPVNVMEKQKRPSSYLDKYEDGEEEGYGGHGNYHIKQQQQVDHDVEEEEEEEGGKEEEDDEVPLAELIRRRKVRTIKDDDEDT